MIKTRKRFVIFAALCVFVLLFVLLGIINGVNFTMASEDADQLTEMLAQQRGVFGNPALPVPDLQGITPPEGVIPPEGITPPEGMTPPSIDPQGNPPEGFFPGFMGPMGPNSPEMESSLRYFTFSFDKEGNAELVALQISAVTEEEALTWACSLLGEQKTGWTRGTYRYRVYKNDGIKYVTVIDQGRELLPCFRILLISGIGLIVGMIASYIALMYIGKRLFQPLEEADRKQKRFIAKAEKEFKVPLTIINANTEIMEREMGETEQTQSINRQVKQMIGLVKNLSTVGVFDEKELTMLQCDLSALAQAAGDAAKARFEEKGLRLTIAADQPAAVLGDSEAMNDLISELLDNQLKFASAWAELKVVQKDGHSVITASNDTALPNGNLDQAFDRFTRLSNAGGVPGVGLGLSHVKEIARAHNGRVSAKAADGAFILRVIL
ncbi:MAG: GHKL domain-containing protein [Clostridia bacterium]|nr:GHKL domain-containing protein [Clostridia bacterium]